MVKNNNSFIKYSLLLLLVFSFITLQAQDNRYMIFFPDKDTVTYTYEDPEAYLSPRAIARREKFEIPVQFSDLPVNPGYIQEITRLGGEVMYTTRWFNGALIACDDSTLEKILTQDFVIDAELVKPSAKGSRRKEGASVNKWWKFRKKLKKQEELLNVVQNEMLGVDKMHELGYNGEGLMVAVFDGGFRGVDTVPFFRHLFENQQLIPGYDFVGNSPDVFKYGQHGTEALSCIAAYNPGILEAGAYAADIMLCITEESGSEYRIEEYNWLFAAERADSAGTDIISTSLGYTTFNETGMDYNFSDLDGKTTTITRAVNVAASKGIVCVISAGNEGIGSWRYISPPADAPDILAVGAVNSSGSRASFSSFGPTADGRIKPDVSALGLQTVVVNAQGQVTTSSGTSFSAPLIAGFVAGVWQAFPDLNNKEIIEKVKLAGHQAMAPDNELGYGVPDFSVLMKGGLTPVADKEVRHYFHVFPNPLEEGKVFIESKSDDYIGEVDLLLYNSTGQVVYQKRVTHTGSKAMTIDSAHLDKGIYILRILSPDLSDTFKLVKF